MDENLDAQPDNQIALTADIVAAYVSNNAVPVAGLSDLIASVHGALIGLGTPREPAEAVVEKPTAAQIRKSITDDALISFEDGKPYKTLRRHLTIRGLTPETYRAKHGLPADYPMTAAAYSAQRSALAHSLGLGQQRRQPATKAAEASEAVSEAPKAPRVRSKADAGSEAAPEKAKGRGRPRKAAEAEAAE